MGADWSARDDKDNGVEKQINDRREIHVDITCPCHYHLYGQYPKYMSIFVGGNLKK